MTSEAARRLIVMRHAKAEAWSGSDHSRELATRGKRDAVDAGRWLAAEGFVPDVVVVSSAARAQQTSEGVVEGLAREVPVIVSDELYAADEHEVLALCAERLPAGARCALVVGHNPTIAMAAHLVQPESERQDVDFPTSALAVFSVDREWSALEPGAGTYVASYSPGAS